MFIYIIRQPICFLHSIMNSKTKPRNLLRGLYSIEFVFQLIQQRNMPRNRYNLFWD